MCPPCQIGFFWLLLLLFSFWIFLTVSSYPHLSFWIVFKVIFLCFKLSFLFYSVLIYNIQKVTFITGKAHFNSHIFFFLFLDTLLIWINYPNNLNFYCNLFAYHTKKYCFCEFFFSKNLFTKVFTFSYFSFFVFLFVIP